MATEQARGGETRQEPMAARQTQDGQHPTLHLENEVLCLPMSQAIIPRGSYGVIRSRLLQEDRFLFFKSLVIRVQSRV